MMDAIRMSDSTVRRAVFDWLAEQAARYDDGLPWLVLIPSPAVAHRMV